MPRYIARLRETRQFHFYLSLPCETHSHAEFIAAADALHAPNPWAGDWRITEIDSISYHLPPSRDDRGNWAMHVYRPVTAETSILVYAKNEKAARAIVAKDMLHNKEHRIHHSDQNWTGWQHKGEVEILSIVQDRSGKNLRHSFEIEVDKLVAPDQSYFPLNEDQIFETIRHLAISGAGYEEKCRYHTPTVNDLLSGGYGDVAGNPFHFYQLKPILSINDLKARFQYALLARSYGFYEQWRQDVGFKLGKTLTIKAAHRGSTWQDIVSGKFTMSLNEALHHFLEDTKGMKMAVSLNDCHPGAIVIQQAAISVDKTGFNFIIRYGYPDCTSYWDFTVASTRGGETFIETFDRAYNLLHRLIPDFKEQREAMLDARWKRGRERHLETESA